MLALAAVASAKPAADPSFYYHTGLPYYHVPVVYTAPVGCRNYLGAVVPCAGGEVAAAPVEEARKKRSAEAHVITPAATIPYVYSPLTYKLPAAPVGCTNNEGAAVPCAYGYAFPHWPFLVPAAAAQTEPAAVEEARKKRDAEPDADAEADPWLLYGGLGYGYGAGYGYGYGYGLGAHYPYTYAAYHHPLLPYGGCRNNAGSLVPCAYGK